MIAKYKNDYCKDKQYYFNINGGVDHFVPTELDAFEYQSNPYSNYLTEELAEQAKKLKDFNDKLLAFKYCYDLDYKPNFNDDYDNRTYYVFYDSDEEKYDWTWTSVSNYNLVYFSTKEIAQKCADWLNSLSE